MAKKSESAPTSTEPQAEPAADVPLLPTAWDTTIKLGSIEEATYAAIGAVVVAVDKSTGEVTLRSMAETQPHGRSREAW